ncbi:MAG: aminopeptidase P N-terminal domain-containing protein, partial [Oscillospiraceae bacterium]|nr:aminopeptidase P N-terminal domain-containing protein [Oscillospiraceae bacterium]
MEASFHRENRKNLLEAMPDNSAAVLFSGNAPRQSADAYYPFFCSRNFLYLTGVDFAGFILFLQKTKGTAREVLYILPHDLLKERWTGRRPTAEEASAQSGIEDVRYVESFEEDFRRAATGGAFDSLWLDLFNHTPEEEPGEAHRFA